MKFSALLICNSYENDQSGQQPLRSAASDGKNVEAWLKAQLQVGAGTDTYIQKKFNADATAMKNALLKLGKTLEGINEKPLV